ncbi:YtxH domain-containing protein [Pseudogracilibacillus sp. SO30301A]|uniref:YtxH domain-containing protein n=1 Tax=Pseudogracilibacillus sp. SO30301A TaxID=3098291 RepID=UPI00300DE59E
MSKGKSILIGFIVGGTISAATTLLTTPSSGRELRYRVKQQSIEWKKIVDDIIQDGLRLKDQIAKTSKEGVALINELTQEMKTSVEEWKSAIEPQQENIHEYLEQIQASIKELEEKINEKKSEA